MNKLMCKFEATMKKKKRYQSHFYARCPEGKSCLKMGSASSYAECPEGIQCLNMGSFFFFLRRSQKSVH